MAMDYLQLTRKLYFVAGALTRKNARTSKKRRIVSFIVISSMFVFNLHGFYNGCILEGLTHDSVSQTIVFFVIHIQSAFKLGVLLVDRGGNMQLVLQFVEGYIFVNDSYSKHIYVISFFTIALTVLAYALFPLVWYSLPFYYEPFWGLESFLTFSITYILLFTDLYLIQFVSVLNDFTYLMCADAICVRLKYVKSCLESIQGEQDEGKLIEATKEHQAILRILNLLSELISPNFFTQVFSTLCIVCFSAFSAVTSDPQHFSACLSSFCTLLLYCWLGQMITNATEDLHFASYNNGWDNCNNRMKKILEIISLYTKEPFEFKGLSVVKMNLQTFKEVLTDSYSYLMLLMTMAEPE